MPPRAPSSASGRRYDDHVGTARAAACGITGRRLAKAVVVHDGDWFGLAVIPATAHVDVAQLRTLTGRPQLILASEPELASLFPDCEPGAMPPFGRLYGLSAFLDISLIEEPQLVFEAGTHREEVRMPVDEYLRMEEPVIAADRDDALGVFDCSLSA